MIDIGLLAFFLMPLAPAMVLLYLILSEMTAQYALIVDATTKTPRLRKRKILKNTITLYGQRHDVGAFAESEELPVILTRGLFFSKLAPLFIFRQGRLEPLSLTTTSAPISAAQMAAILERQSLKTLLRYSLGRLDMILYLLMGVGMGLMAGILMGIYVIPPPAQHAPSPAPTSPVPKG